MGLERELWVPGIQENPVPDHSFVLASTDMSGFVNNNTLHLTEAGIEPTTYENFFEGNENGVLPIQDVKDIPHEVVLKIYSTAQTRHRNLEEVELDPARRDSVVNRHRTSMSKKLAVVASRRWTTEVNDAFNKLMNLSDTDSVIDAITDLSSFYMDLDIDGQDLNLCLNASHWARIRKEDKKLYKDLRAEKGLIYEGFKIHSYSKTPIYTSAGVKKPEGALLEAGDKRSSFAWVTQETFRSFGDTEMYFNEKDSGIQADTLSFGQRALIGNIRANSPKYLATII